MFSRLPPSYLNERILKDIHPLEGVFLDFSFEGSAYVAKTRELHQILFLFLSENKFGLSKALERRRRKD